MNMGLLRVMGDKVSHLGHMIQGLRGGTMTMDLPTDHKKAMVAIKGIHMIILSSNHPVVRTADPVNLHPLHMASSMGNTMDKIPHSLTPESMIITQGEWGHHRVGELTHIGMEGVIRLVIAIALQKN